MKDIIRAVLEYEYLSGFCGLQQSIYTAEIIEIELKKLIRHNIEVEDNTVYTVCKGSKVIEIKKFDSLDKAKEYALESFNEIYIVYDRKLWIIGESDSDLGVSLVWDGAFMINSTNK